MKQQLDLTAVWHFDKEDTDFGGDYHYITLFDNGGNQVHEFGDAYHDRGQEKLEGFIMGLRWLGYEVILERKEVADSRHSG